MLGGGILLLMVLLPLAVTTLNAQERLPKPDPPQVNGRTVSWDAVENAVGYRLRWRRSDQNWNQAPRLDTSATHHTFSAAELPDGPAYRVQVRALSGDRAQRDNSPWSDAADLTATVPATATPTPTATLTPTLTHTPTDTPTPTATTTPTLTATPADRLKPVTGLRFLPSNGAGLGTFQWDLLPKPDGEFHRTFQVRYRPHDAAQWQSEAGFYGVFNLMQVRDWSPYVPWQVQVRAVDEEQPHLNGEWSAVATMQPLPRPTATYTPSPTHTFTATSTHSPTPTFTHTPTYTYTPTFTPTPTFTHTPTYTYTPTFTLTPTDTYTPSPTPVGKLEKVTGLYFTPSHTAGFGILHWSPIMLSDGTAHAAYEVRYRPHANEVWLIEPSRAHVLDLTRLRDWSPYIPWQVQVRAINLDDYRLHGDWSDTITMQPLPTPIPTSTPTLTPSNTPLPPLGRIDEITVIHGYHVVDGEIFSTRDYLLCIDFVGDPDSTENIGVTINGDSLLSISLLEYLDWEKWLGEALGSRKSGASVTSVSENENQINLEDLEEFEKCYYLLGRTLPLIGNRYCAYTFRGNERSKEKCISIIQVIDASTPIPPTSTNTPTSIPTATFTATATATPQPITLTNPSGLRLSGSNFCWNNVPHASGYRINKSGGFFAEFAITDDPASDADHSTTDPGGGSGGSTCRNIGSLRPGLVLSVKALGSGRYRDSGWSYFSVPRPTARPTQRPPTAVPPTRVPPTRLPPTLHPTDPPARLYHYQELRLVPCMQDGQPGLCQERRQCSRVCWVNSSHVCWNHRCGGWGRTGAFIPAALPGS